MIKKYVYFLLFLFLIFSVVACSIPPEVPVTRKQLLDTNIYRAFVVKESPEQILNALNAQGDVVIEGQRRLGNKLYPVHIKLLATPFGVEVVDYDR